MERITVGDTLKCVFNQPLPGNDHAPELELGKEYPCVATYTENGNLHIGVGLPLKIGYVSSYATGEHLPSVTHWCHPNRFVIVKKAQL